jgi:hypothetical protein
MFFIEMVLEVKMMVTTFISSFDIPVWFFFTEIMLVSAACYLISVTSYFTIDMMLNQCNLPVLI